MATYRIPFSRIRAAWLRRSLMAVAYPVMLTCNWLLILWAAALTLLRLPLIVLVKAIAAPFQLLNDGFTEAWHGRGPGSDRPTSQVSVDQNAARTQQGQAGDAREGGEPA